MLGFFSPKKAEVHQHWFALVEDFSLSTQDFYAAIEKELEHRKIPGLDIAHVDFAEGGVLSAKREYLRLTRERLVFDICAAPFGTGFFFSSRFAELPLKINPWAIVLLMVAFFIGLEIFFRFFGFFFGLPLFICVVVFLIWLLRNAVALGLKDIDASLLKTPLLGALYEKWFRQETYYREDTRLMYLETIPAIVKALVGDLTAEKGIKLIRQYEQAPILGDLYRPIAGGMTNAPPIKERPGDTS